jgi:hypothetical protein
VVGRVLALIFLGLALVFCVALAASESLTNRTGRTATAVAVTFSEQVRITSYDETVFPTKAPSSRSETFRFSGGQLENGARFSVSWTPSTAEITSTEWETTGAPSGSTGGSAPLTYEQIMAQIAHYPGPEEPLYVPAEGEQVWLTDLEGHADIYDNDSIKINYAPGFDKSQITRIDVYRNGVKLRFVPALFDVLTNEQMKTFDGNPAENTPKSEHTDHAVFGYEYSFRLSLAGSQSFAQQVTVKSPVTVSCGYKYADLLSTWNWAVAADWMSDSTVQEYIFALAGLGFNGVYFDVALFTRDDHQASFFAQYQHDPDVAPEWMLTASDRDILDLLSWIDAAGLDAELGVQLHVAPFGSSENGHRSFTHPDDVDTWFANYTQSVIHYAQLAKQGGAEYFRPVVEFNTMQRQTQQMNVLLDACHAVFSGDLVVAESINHHIYDMADFWFASFWDHADLVHGLNCWSPTLETQKDQRLSYMGTRFVTDWLAVVTRYRTEQPGTPLIFSELGWFNHDGSALGLPDSHLHSGARDDQEMADAWAAYLIAAEYLGLDGVCVWTMELASPRAREGGSCINDSSALSVVASLLGGTPTTRIP